GGEDGGLDDGTPFSAGSTGGYHLADIFWMPASLGCTPSPVSVAVLNPVHWSTTVIGDCAVLLALTQAGMALSKVTTRCPHSGQLLGFIGRIFATISLVFGFEAR